MSTEYLAIFTAAYLAYAHFKGITKQALLAAILATSILLAEGPMITLGILSAMAGIWFAKWVKDFNYNLHIDYYLQLHNEYTKLLKSLPDFYEFEPTKEDDQEHIFIVKEGDYAGLAFGITLVTKKYSEYRFLELCEDVSFNEIQPTEEDTKMADAFSEMLRMREELEL